MGGYSAPHFERIAAAHGVPSATVIAPCGVDHGLARCFADQDSPFLLVAKVHAMANAFPKVALGRPSSQMEPLMRSIGMEGT